MDTSLARWFDAASTITFGKVHVTLCKRRVWKSAEELARAGPPREADGSIEQFPCAEVLYVVVDNGFSDEDSAAYIRFHNAYVLHRVQKEWPHTFALVYDVRNVKEPDSWPAFFERAMAFSLMHSNLGEHYMRWLHGVSVIIGEARYIPLIQQARAPFMTETTPHILFRTPHEKLPLAEAIRRSK